MSGAVDPITLEVLRNRFDAIAAETQTVLLRSAYSVILKEGEDCSAALFNARGEIIAQSTALPQHMGAFIPALARIMAEYPPAGMRDGDIYTMNDPHDGGTHLPDLIVVAPVIALGRVIAFSVCLAHQEDIGGKVPGSMPTDSTDIWQEGLIVPPLALYQAGVANRTLFNIIERNVRLPRQVLGDLAAQVSAVTVGRERLQDVCRQYGIETVLAYMDHLLDYAERRTRARIATIPDGIYRFTDYMDNDGIDLDRRVPISIAVEIKGDDAIVDYAGTSPQVEGPINAPLSGAQASVYFAFRCVTDPTIPNNHGCYRPITVIVPPGSLLNPRPGAPVAIRAHTLKRAADTVLGALVQAVPDRVPAAPAGSISCVSFGGTRADGERFGLSDLIAGAGGARPNQDGIEAIDTDVSNCMNVPAEAIEMAYPLRVLYYRLRRDGGGPGRQRGGTGIERALEVTEGTIVASYRSERHYTSPWGLFGGRAAPRWRTEVRRAGGRVETVPSKARLNLAAGDVLYVATGGGGGHGHPYERPVEAVLADIRDGKVSPRAAERDYGVVLDAAGAPDAPATEARRGNRPRGENAIYDRGPVGEAGP
ncbi:MAG: hydantoinase B/oxoprolinase family protein [Alphaproteobacteria bacterium]|nr:hydantoinase B/oxoprolinase family protein [Alphaproteobacteria bacterium]